MHAAGASETDPPSRVRGVGKRGGKGGRGKKWLLVKRRSFGAQSHSCPEKNPGVPLSRRRRERQASAELRRLLLSGDVGLVLKLVMSNASCLRESHTSPHLGPGHALFSQSLGQVKVGSQVFPKAEDEEWLGIGTSTPKLYLR